MLPTPDGPPRIRVSDVDRDRYIGVLRTNCADGRLTLEEFSDRVGAIYEATVQHELDAIVADLPRPWSPPSPTVTRSATVRQKVRSTRWHLAICGQTIRRGPYRVPDETAAVAICGECTLDLTEAVIDGASVTIDAVAICGQVTVIVPPGFDVAVDGVVIAGEKRFDDDDLPPPAPGAPAVLVRALAICGAVRVRRRASKRPAPAT